jgi:hypothetical protein
MPTGKNWFQFIYVNLSFGLFLLLIYLYEYIKEIKDQWPKYRCNPIFMPLADNIQQNFQYCIQSGQSSFMGHLLQPLTTAASEITDVLGQSTNDVNNIRKMFDKTRKFLFTIIQSIFGLFLNLVIEFERITIETKEIISKQTTILTILQANTKNV